MSALSRIGGGLAAAIVAATLVLPFVGGYPLAYGLMALTLLAALWLLATRTPLRFDLEARLLAVAFALIALAFIPTGSLPLAANFLMFLLLAPLSTALSRFASPTASTTAARLALLGTLVAVATAGWEVMALGHTRATGAGSDSIWSAQTAVILGFLALLGVPQAHGPWRLLYWLGPLLGLVAALLAGSRGPLLAVPALLLVSVLIVADRRRWLLLLAIAAGGLALATVLSLAFPALLERLLQVPASLAEVAQGSAPSDASAGDRLAFYQSSLAAFLRSPLYGYGWDAKIAAIVPYLADGGAMLAGGHHHLHSDLLDFGVAAGALGLLAYGLVLAAPLAGALASPRDGQRRARLLGGSILAVGYFVCGLTYLMFGYEFHTTLYVCLAAIIGGYCRDVPAAAAPSAP